MTQAKLCQDTCKQGTALCHPQSVYLSLPGHASSQSGCDTQILACDSPGALTNGEALAGPGQICSDELYVLIGWQHPRKKCCKDLQHGMAEAMMFQHFMQLALLNVILPGLCDSVARARRPCIIVIMYVTLPS